MAATLVVSRRLFPIKVLHLWVQVNLIVGFGYFVKVGFEWGIEIRDVSEGEEVQREAASMADDQLNFSHWSGC